MDLPKLFQGTRRYIAGDVPISMKGFDGQRALPNRLCPQTFFKNYASMQSTAIHQTPASNHTAHSPGIGAGAHRGDPVGTLRNSGPR